MPERTFDDVRREAKELGIKIPGKKAIKIEEEILEARAKIANSPIDEPKEDMIKPKKDMIKPKEFNAVVIFRGKMKIRTYTEEIHGKNFALLAKEFAESEKIYKAEKILVKDEIACPHCGNYFAPRS